MKARTRSRQAGITLVELMVTLVIAGIAIGAALQLGYLMMDSYRDHRQMVVIDRAARVSLEILSGAIRNTCPGVPTGDIRDAVSCAPGGAIRVNNNTDAPDSLEIIYASGGVVTSSRSAFASGSTDVRVLDASGFAKGDLAIITDTTVGHLVRVTDVDTTADPDRLVIAPPCTGAAFPAGGYAPGALVIRARMATFFVAEVQGVPMLLMDPDGGQLLAAEPIAEGIEDMQIAVGIDQDGDGTLEGPTPGTTTDEWHYNVAGDSAPPPVTSTPWRALRVTLVARSLVPDPSHPTSIRPAVEDRPAAPSEDELRRRVLSATVEIRNLKGSP